MKSDQFESEEQVPRNTRIFLLRHYQHIPLKAWTARSQFL